MASGRILNKITAYLRGTSNYKSLRREFEAYDYEEFQGELTSNLTPAEITHILDTLNILSGEREGILKKQTWTLEGLLFRLRRQTLYTQLDDTLELIEEKKKPSFGLILSLSLGSGLAGSAAILGLVLGIFYYPVHFLQLMGFLFPDIIPPVALAIQLVRGIYEIYKICSNRRLTTEDQNREAFFILSRTVLNATASSLWIALGMNPLVASLCIIAATVDTINEIIAVIQLHKKFKEQPLTDQGNLASAQAAIRLKMSYQHHYIAGGIKIGVALILVGIVAAWSLLPGGIALTLGMLALMAAVWALQYLLLKLSAKMIQNETSRQLTGEEKKYSLLSESNSHAKSTQVKGSPRFFGIGKQSNEDPSPEMMSLESY